MMRELLRLTRANLLEKPLVNSLNITVLAIGTAMLSVLFQFSNHMDRQLTRDLAGADLVVGAKGSPMQLILSSVLHMDTPIGNIPLAEATQLRRNPLVRSATPVALGDSFRGFRLVGTTPEFTTLYGASLKEGNLWQGPQEVVIGARVQALLGMNMGQRFISAHGLGQSDSGNAHESHPYKVVGILEATGTVLDRLILTSLDSIWHAHGHESTPEGPHESHLEEGRHHGPHQKEQHGEEPQEHGEEPHGKEPHGKEHHGKEHHDNQAHEAPALEVTAVLVRFASPRAALMLPRQINARAGLQAAVPAIEVTRVLALSSGVATAGRTIGAALAITAAFGLFASMTNAMSHRAYDIALVRVMGASRIWVMTQCLLEGITLAFIGAVLGIALGHAGLAVAAATSDTLGASALNGSVLAMNELWLVPAVILLGALAALVPATKAYRQDISRLLKEGSSV